VKSGEIVRVQNSPTTSFILIRPSSGTHFAYRCITSNRALRDAANSIGATRNRVIVRGDIASCPADVVGEDIDIGTCVNIDLN
jgi:hypothetical protein